MTDIAGPFESFSAALLHAQKSLPWFAAALVPALAETSDDAGFTWPRLFDAIAKQCGVVFFCEGKSWRYESTEHESIPTRRYVVQGRPMEELAPALFEQIGDKVSLRKIERVLAQLEKLGAGLTIDEAVYKRMSESAQRVIAVGGKQKLSQQATIYEIKYLIGDILLRTSGETDQEWQAGDEVTITKIRSA